MNKKLKSLKKQQTEQWRPNYFFKKKNESLSTIYCRVVCWARKNRNRKWNLQLWKYLLLLTWGMPTPSNQFGKAKHQLKTIMGSGISHTEQDFQDSTIKVRQKLFFTFYLACILQKKRTEFDAIWRKSLRMHDVNQSSMAGVLFLLQPTTAIMINKQKTCFLNQIYYSLN